MATQTRRQKNIIKFWENKNSSIFSCPNLPNSKILLGANWYLQEDLVHTYTSWKSKFEVSRFAINFVKFWYPIGRHIA